MGQEILKTKCCILNVNVETMSSLVCIIKRTGLRFVLYYTGLTMLRCLFDMFDGRFSSDVDTVYVKFSYFTKNICLFYYFGINIDNFDTMTGKTHGGNCFEITLFFRYNEYLHLAMFI